VIDRLIDPASRAEPLRFIYRRLQFAESCVVAGLNDVGKTTLLSLAQQPDVVRRYAPADLHQNRLFIRIDCNLLAAAAEHELYAVMARAAAEAAQRAGHLAAADRAAAYGGYDPAEGSSAVMAAVQLEALLVQLVEEERLSLVVLLDEFDALYRRLEPRVALALRAFDNRLGPALAYVVAVDLPLRRVRATQGDDTAEFEELFLGGALTLGPLDRQQGAALVTRYVESRGATVPQWLPPLVAELSGGHPGLLWACAAAALTLRATSPAEVERGLLASAEVTAECDNIWLRLPPAEREAVQALRLGHPADAALVAGLRQRHLLLPGTGSTLAFPLLERHVAVSAGQPRAGLVFDAQTGEVSVDGVRVPVQLGPTEFRLMQALSRRPGALVAKDEIARSVWPDEERLRGVDDARIDKLVDRVRAKIEPDAKNPRFLLTVRGLGYRLMTKG
jgi:hypothetical protein